MKTKMKIPKISVPYLFMFGLGITAIAGDTYVGRAIHGIRDDIASIDGTIIEEEQYDPTPTQQLMFGIPQGRAYTIQDKSGKVYVAMITNGTDPLNEGNKGTFNLSGEVFSGRLEQTVAGQIVRSDFTGHELKNYSLTSLSKTSQTKANYKSDKK
jgi:hypothetical protein